MTDEDLITPKYDPSGLIPAIVQDDDTNAVLMMAWMNKDAYDLTRRTGQVHFWSRSRQEIWRKGATSGNTLTLVSLWIDCDADTLLVRVKPAGPACHTGNTSCFYRRVK
jgi:phosphoribosyl-AMP cyclohydrolase